MHINMTGQELIDGGDVNVFILEQMPLAKKLAYRFKLMNPSKWNDIESVAILGMVEAVHKMVSNKAKYPGSKVLPSLNRSIHNRIVDFLMDDHFIRIPSKSWRQAIDLGQPLQRIIVTPLNTDQHNKDIDVYDNRYVNALQTAETREAFEKTLNDFEKDILEYRMLRMSQTEIARKMACSVQWINTTLKGMRKKYVKLSTYKKRTVSLS